MGCGDHSVPAVVALAAECDHKALRRAVPQRKAGHSGASVLHQGANSNALLDRALVRGAHLLGCDDLHSDLSLSDADRNTAND